MSTWVSRNVTDMKALFRTYHNKRQQAVRDQLVLAHTQLVRSIAWGFRDRGEPIEDLVQVGIIGLINAIDRFDPDHGTEFSTYATPTIAGEIRRHFRDKGWDIHVPRWLQELSGRVTKAQSELAQMYNHEPSNKDVADYLEIDEEDVVEAIKARGAYNAESLDAPLEEGSNATIADLIQEIAVDEDRQDIELLRETYTKLPPLERSVIAVRLGGLSQTDTGKKLGYSQMHVSRTEARAVNHMRILLAGGTIQVRRRGKIKRRCIRLSSDLALIKSTTLARIAIAIWPMLSDDGYRVPDWDKVAAEAGLGCRTVKVFMDHLADGGIVKRYAIKKRFVYKRGIGSFQYTGKDEIPVSDVLWLLREEVFDLDVITIGKHPLPRRAELPKKGPNWARSFNRSELCFAGLLLAELPSIRDIRDSRDMMLRIGRLLKLDGHEMYFHLARCVKKGILVRKETLLAPGIQTVQISSRAKIPELGISDRRCDLRRLSRLFCVLEAYLSRGYLEESLKGILFGTGSLLTVNELRVALICRRMKSVGNLEEILTIIRDKLPDIRDPELIMRLLERKWIYIQDPDGLYQTGLDRFTFCPNTSRAMAIDVLGGFKLCDSQSYSMSTLLEQARIREARKLPVLQGMQLAVALPVWPRISYTTFRPIDKPSIARLSRKAPPIVTKVIGELEDDGFIIPGPDKEYRKAGSKFRVTRRVEVYGLTLVPDTEYSLDDLFVCADFSVTEGRL